MSVRRWLSACAFALALAHLFSTSRSGAAAEFWFEPIDEVNDIAALTLYGEITEGDSDRLINALLVSIKERDQFIDRVNLFSPGGNAVEGIKLGHIINKYYLATEAPSVSESRFVCYGYPGSQSQPFSSDNCVCASACAIAWLGGIERRGIAGFHRMYSTYPKMTAAKTSEIRRVFNNEIDKFLEKVGAPSFVLDLIENSGPNELSFPSPEQRVDLEYGLNHSFTVDANCQGQSMNAGEKRIFFDLLLKSRGSDLLPDDERTLYKLNLSYEREDRCANDVRRRELFDAQQELWKAVQ